jgi:VanZ family protein
VKNPRNRDLGWVDVVLWIATAASAGLTLWFSFAKPPDTAGITEHDKVMHALAYFLITLCFLLAAVWRPGRGPGPFPAMGAVAPLVALGVGIVVEVLQSLTTTRRGEVRDVLAEAIGVAAALGLVVLLRSRESTRRPSVSSP